MLFLLPTLVAFGAPVEVRPLAAHHLGRHDGDVLAWQTVAVVDAAELSRAAHRLRFAAPLPSGASVESEATLTIVHDDAGRILAVDVPPGSWGPERHIRDRWTRPLRLTIRFAVAERDQVPLIVPLLAGDAVQRIDLDGTEELLFEPEPAIGIERHIRHYVAQEITSDQRRTCKRLLREHGIRSTDSLAIFVTANTRVVEAGRVGTIISREAHRRLVAAGAVIGSALLALAMLLAYRRLSRTAQIERSLAIIDRDLAESSRAPPEDTR